MSGNDGLTEVLEKTKLVWDGTRNVVDAAPELSCHGKATKKGGRETIEGARMKRTHPRKATKMR